MLFVDYINICDVLYDGIEIDKNTIYLINSNFRLYNVEPQSFYFYFRNKLILILPQYYNMIKNEMRNELFNISNNINYRRLAEAKISNAIDTAKRDNDFTRTVKDTEDIDKTGKIDYDGSTTNQLRESFKESPMSIENNLGTFDNLFNWASSSNIKQNRNNIDEEQLTKTTDNSSRTYNSGVTDKNESLEVLKNLTNNLNDSSELNEGSTILAVEAIEKINNFIMSNNHAQFYLINKIKPCFINVY